MAGCKAPGRIQLGVVLFSKPVGRVIGSIFAGEGQIYAETSGQFAKRNCGLREI